MSLGDYFRGQLLIALSSHFSCGRGFRIEVGGQEESSDFMVLEVVEGTLKGGRDRKSVV